MAACRSVNTVLQKQLSEEKNNKEQILRDRDQLAQVRRLPLYYTFITYVIVAINFTKIRTSRFENKVLKIAT